MLDLERKRNKELGLDQLEESEQEVSELVHEEFCRDILTEKEKELQNPTKKFDRYNPDITLRTRPHKDLEWGAPIPQEELDKKPWGAGFKGGAGAINVKGRPKNDVSKKSNKDLRMSAMLGLVRLLRPHLGKSVMAASKIIDDRDSKDGDKLKAASFLVGFYKDALKEAYDAKYDADFGEKINEEVQPVFSLKMIDVDVDDTSS